VSADELEFDWPKHHLKQHVIDDIWQAGATPNFSTRVGEGVHQEIREEYARTNGKNVESQVRAIQRGQSHSQY
jgi:hypothetical protein